MNSKNNLIMLGVLGFILALCALSEISNSSNKNTTVAIEQWVIGIDPDNYVTTQAYILPNSSEVHINYQKKMIGIDYNETSNRIVFTATPSEGSVVEVKYVED